MQDDGLFNISQHRNNNNYNNHVIHDIDNNLIIL